MRERWKQAGLILLVFLALVLADAAAALLLRKSSLPPFAVLVALAIASIAMYLAAVKRIERRVATEFSLRHALPEVGGGFLGGVGLISGAIAILWMVGVYRPEGWGVSASVGHSAWQLAVGSMYYLAAAAIPEEILFRGLLFRMCSKIVGTWGALFVSAVAFGAVHSDAGAPLAAQLSIMLSGGVVLGAAYAATGRLWLPIGLHWGFDFAEDKVFGGPTSGHIGSGLVVGQVTGPNILTGGVWGVDASIVTIVLCLAIATYLLGRTLRLHRTEPPIWSDVDRVPSGGV